MSGAFLASALVVLAILFPVLSSIKSVYLGASEEILKFGMIIFLIYLVQIKPKPMAFIGIGFGLTEGIAYASSIGYTEIDPLWMHIIVGLVMAFFFHLAFKTRVPFSRGLYYGLALIIPMFLHIFYNLSIFDVVNTVYFI